jgi:hypothetical protein
VDAFAFRALDGEGGTVRPDGGMAPNKLSCGDDPLVVSLGPLDVNHVGMAAKRSS